MKNKFDTSFVKIWVSLETHFFGTLLDNPESAAEEAIDFYNRLIGWIDASKLSELEMACILRGLFRLRKRIPNWYVLRDNCEKVLGSEKARNDVLRGLFND